MTPLRCLLLYGGGLLLGGVLVTSAGCEGSSSKRSSQAQQFSGEWDVDCVRADIQGCKQVDSTYFRFSSGSGTKSYRLARIERDDTTAVAGNVEVIADGRLRMTGDFFPGGLLWAFDFEEPDPISGSVQLVLVQKSGERSIQAFLNFFDRTEVRPEVRMDLFER